MGKFKTIAAICGLGLGLVAGAPAAHAGSFIPQQEGEILLNNTEFNGEDYECVADNCIDTSKNGFSVTSLDYDKDDTDPQYGLSRLFVDTKETINNHGSHIKFATTDAGTNETDGEYWFRSVAYREQADGSYTPEEEGNLEIGRFLFDFDKVYEKIVLDLFDVESSGFSGILEVNGQKVDNMLLDAGANGETQTLTLTNVSSFVLQLGEPQAEGFSTGDGVNLSGIKSVPEPTTTFSLGALAVAGMFGVKKRQKFKK